MESPGQRRTTLVIAGAAVALLTGVVFAWLLLASGRGERTGPPPASQAGLVIDSSGTDDGRIDPAQPLRCFVQGQYVGEFSLNECAQRNGVATGALDVGIDETGALAASDAAGTLLTPLPPGEEGAAPPEAVEPPAPVNAEAPAPAAGPPATCWRHRNGQWRRLTPDMDLNACVQALFAGRCERPGQAAYGRWGQQTIRLVTGRVEISGDNQSFRTLANQGANCSIPPVG